MDNNALPDGILRKTANAVLIIEWDIANYRDLWRRKGLCEVGIKARSPKFQMRGATWSFEIYHVRPSLSYKEVEVHVCLVRHQYETEHQSIPVQMVIQVNKNEICGGYRKDFVFGSANLKCHYFAVKEKELSDRMSSDDLAVLCTVYPEVEQQRSVVTPTNVFGGGKLTITDNEGTNVLPSPKKELFLIP